MWFTHGIVRCEKGLFPGLETEEPCTGNDKAYQHLMCCADCRCSHRAESAGLQLLLRTRTVESWNNMESQMIGGPHYWDVEMRGRVVFHAVCCYNTCRLQHAVCGGVLQLSVQPACCGCTLCVQRCCILLVSGLVKPGGHGDRV